MLKILSDKRERRLLLLATLSFVILCLIEIKLPLISFLENTLIGDVLCSDGIQNIASGLLVGLISAYAFYIFINYLPRVHREEKTKEVLNSLIASILDAYKRCRIYGHETPISHVDKSVLKNEWLNEQITDSKKNKTKFLPLKFAMQTAYTRVEDFRHTLSLAVELSPEHAMQWLIIIDKVRLMAENYGEELNIPIDKQQYVDQDNDLNPIRDYKSTLNLRYLEIVEESKNWINLDAIGNS